MLEINFVLADDKVEEVLITEKRQLMLLFGRDLATKEEELETAGMRRESLAVTATLIATTSMSMKLELNLCFTKTKGMLFALKQEKSIPLVCSNNKG